MLCCRENQSAGKGDELQTFFCTISFRIKVVEAGESLGLQHREEIMLSRPEEDEVLTENCTLLTEIIFCMQVGLATRLVVSPATPEDWTVLRLNRRKVEREVLDQVVSPF